jgi:perosamine synthetase
MAADAEAIVAAIGRAVGPTERPLHLHEPRFAGHEWTYVKECLDTGWVSSAGRFVDQFEVELARTCGARFAIAIVNGTAALHVALRLVGVGPGDEVIVPALTFVATANAVTYCGAIPQFVDSDPATLGLDPEKLQARLQRIALRRDGALINKETGRPIRAVVPVHVFGHPVDMDALGAVCAQFGVAVVEDATESLGSTYHGRPCGSLGRAGVLSFNGNKIVTTGGGGAIVTNDEELAHRAKHLTTTAKQPHPWAFLHDEIGWNYRLPNINAALGLAQLEQLGSFVAAKRVVAQRYAEAFAGVPGVRWMKEPEGSSSNYWLNAILLDDDDMKTRDRVLQACHDAGFLARPAWTLMHRLTMFKNSPRDDLANAESIERRLINLPSSAVLGLSDHLRQAALAEQR